MLAFGDRKACRQPQYNGTETPRLSWLYHRLIAGAALLCMLGTGGCSYQLDSLLSKSAPNVDQTGSIGRPVNQAVQKTEAAAPSEADLAYARAVASDALSRGGQGSSIPWQNPQTGVGGNITPLATAYSEGGLPCRDFLASYVRGPSQTWLEGAACRTSQGKWEVKSLTPFKQG